MLSTFFLLAFFTLVNAHPHPVENEEECTCQPGAKAFESYHIHVMFFPDGIDQFSNNTHNSKYARSLRKAFVDSFDVPECDTSRSIFNLTKLCVFPVDKTGAGGTQNAAPFVVPNFAIFVPVNRLPDALPWMMSHRGDLDFILHPNSCGFKCSPEDHVLWSLWGGNKWPVRFQLPILEQMAKSNILL